MPRLASPRLIASLAAALALAGGAWWWLRAPRAVAPPSALLATPEIAGAAVPGKSVFFNPPARTWLAARRPELLAGAPPEPARDWAQAVQDGKIFRRLDRRQRFDAIFLVGDPSQFRPLLEHLLDTRDFTLAHLDHAALVFTRGEGAAWSSAALEPLRARFSSSREQAIFLAQAAAKMVALRLREEALAVLEQARRLDAGVPEVWSGFANYRMARGEWAQALTAADKALALDAEFPPALAAKAQTLFSTKKFGAALKLSEKLLARSPGDPALLFYHAKIAHEARDFGTEIASLQRLVALAEKGGMATAGYRIYLAQAFAADRQAAPAIEHFTRVLAEPELSPEQRKFAEETLAQIKERAQL